MQRNDFNLYILKNGETISSPECNKLPLNTIILYPNPDDNGLECSTGDRRYKARFRIIDPKDNTTKVIDVSMEGYMKFTTKGFLPKDTSNYAAIVTNALEKINVVLAEKDIKIPKDINTRLALNDIQANLAQYSTNLQKHAHELKRGQEEEQKNNAAKQAENAANDKAIAAVIAESLQDIDRLGSVEEKKSNIEEHKNPHTSEQEHKSPKTDASDDHPAVDEVGYKKMPNVLGKLILDLTMDDQSNGFPNECATPSHAQLTLFGRPFLTLPTTLGNMILRGGKRNIDTVLAAVREDPNMFNVEITATDPRGTPVRGTLLQIAAMAGDDEKQYGMVDMLVAAGRLSPEKVIDDLRCVRSSKAQAENEARIQRYVKIFIGFSEIINKGFDKDRAIKMLKSRLQRARRKEICLGLIFDFRILQKAAEWLHNNIPNFTKSDIDILLINGFGTLQSMLSTYDARVMMTGMRDVVNNRIVFATSYESNDEMNELFSCFYNSDSQLGVTFYLDVYGRRVSINTSDNYDDAECSSFASLIQNYIQQKQNRADSSFRDDSDDEMDLNVVRRRW